MLEHCLEAKSILNAMCVEYENVHLFSISPHEWFTAEKLYGLLRIFHKATEAQSESTYVTLSMTEPIYEMLVDALNDFKEVHTQEYLTISRLLRKRSCYPTRILYGQILPDYPAFWILVFLLLVK